jgi:ribose 5-phosphate isomerase B
MKLLRVGIASDHGGFQLKEYLVHKLRDDGYEVVDFGNNIHEEQDDYPDYVIPLARAVANHELTRGIAVCGSGVGACVAVNKIKGIRASLVTDTFSAHQGVEDDNMNMICLGGRITGNMLALEITETFLEARFSGAERHLRRLAKVSKLE